MNPSGRDRLFETHPELCFYPLNGQEKVLSKKTEEGIDHRKELIEDEYAEARVIHRKACDRYLTPEYAPFLCGEDDILDALVAVVTAQRRISKLTRLPEGDNPPRDERSLLCRWSI